MTHKTQERAFVLMPFDQEFEPVYEHLIKKPLEESGYVVTRADSVIDQQNILKDLVAGVAAADLIVADITGLNPNVLYELGLCHGLNVPCVLLTQVIDEVPFDLRSYRHTEYSTRFDKADELKSFLKTVATEHVEGKVGFSSPVSDFLPGVGRPRRWAVKGKSVAPETAARAPSGTDEEPENPDDEEDHDREELGFLDFLQRQKSSAEDVTAALALITETVERSGAKMNERSQEIAEVKRGSGSQAAALIYRIALTAAKDLDQSADELEGMAPEFESSAAVLTDSLAGYVSSMETRDADALRDQLRDARESIAGLVDGIRSGIAGSKTYREGIESLGGISRAMNRSRKRLGRVVDRIIRTMESIEAAASRLLMLSAAAESPPEPVPLTEFAADAETAGAAEI